MTQIDSGKRGRAAAVVVFGLGLGERGAAGGAGGSD
jgi:hypothetical protein